MVPCCCWYDQHVHATDCPHTKTVGRDIARLRAAGEPHWDWPRVNGHRYLTLERPEEADGD
jgi:hypothetical protein